MNIYTPVTTQRLSDKEIKEVRQLIKKRKIDCLTHFTHIKNVKSILKCGLLPRAILRSNPAFASALQSESYLRGAWEKLVPCNLAFPDYQLFRQLQQNNAGDWVVILIDPKILLELPFYFFPDRASEYIYRSDFPGQYLPEYQSVEDLKNLFADCGEVKRGYFPIPDAYPTNPRAELLCHFPISAAFIMKICFFSDYKFNQWVLSNTDFALSCNKNLWTTGLQYFSPRTDYNLWKTNVKFSANREK